MKVSRMALIRSATFAALATSLGLAIPPSAFAVCPPICITPSITEGQANGAGYQVGGTINIKNAFPGNPPLADLPYIVDEENGQDFAVDDPFFGIPTIVKRGDVVKFKGDPFKIGVAINFVNHPLALFLRSQKTISIPAVLLPCQVHYDIIPAFDSAQLGQITVVDEVSPIKNVMLSLVDDVYNALCGAGAAKADIVFINMTTGDNDGIEDLGVGEEIRWYNALETPLTLEFSDGRSQSVPALSYGAPISFPTDGVFTYTFAGYTGMGILQVGTGLPASQASWGTLKASFGATDQFSRPPIKQ